MQPKKKKEKKEFHVQTAESENTEAERICLIDRKWHLHSGTREEHLVCVGG